MCGEHFEIKYVGKIYQQRVQNRVILSVLLSSFWQLLSNIGITFYQIDHVWATLWYYLVTQMPTEVQWAEWLQWGTLKVVELSSKSRFTQCFDSLILATFGQPWHDLWQNWTCLGNAVIFYDNPDAQRDPESPLRVLWESSERPW